MKTEEEIKEKLESIISLKNYIFFDSEYNVGFKNALRWVLKNNNEMINQFENCKIGWKKEYLRKTETKKEFDKFISDFDMTGTNDYIKFPVSYWFRWKCPCCNNYLDIQKLKYKKITQHRYAILNQDLIFICNNCGYKYGYRFIKGYFLNP